MCQNKANLLALYAGRQHIAEASAVQAEEHLVEGHVLVNASHDGAVLLFLGSDACVLGLRELDGVADKGVFDVCEHDIIDLLLVLVSNAEVLLEGYDTIHFRHSSKQILGVLVVLVCH